MRLSIDQEGHRSFLEWRVAENRLELHQTAPVSLVSCLCTYYGYALPSFFVAILYRLKIQLNLPLS